MKVLKPLSEISEETFDILSISGTLLQVYPNAPQLYKDIKRLTRPKILFTPDNRRLIHFTESVITDYIEKGHSKDDIQYAYEELFTTFYGQEFWRWKRELKER